MEYRCKVTVLDKKLFPELQAQFCAVPESGKCPCYNVGDEFIFYRNSERDDYWHMGAGTLTKCGNPDEGCLESPGTMHCGTEGVPFCSEAWDAISRYIYTALQGGSIMHGWMNDDKVMITCCNDGTRPVIFKIERIDVEQCLTPTKGNFHQYSSQNAINREGYKDEEKQHSHDKDAVIDTWVLGTDGTYDIYTDEACTVPYEGLVNEYYVPVIEDATLYMK